MLNFSVLLLLGRGNRKMDFILSILWAVVVIIVTAALVWIRRLREHIAAESTKSEKIRIDPLQKPDEMAAVIHRGVSCDGCGMKYLAGARYKCLICANYDLCSECHAKPQRPHAEHEMTEIVSPTDSKGWLAAFFESQVSVLLAGKWIATSRIAFPHVSHAYIARIYGSDVIAVFTKTFGDVQAATSLEEGLTSINQAICDNPAVVEFIAVKAVLLLKLRKVAESLLAYSEAFEVIRERDITAWPGNLLSHAWHLMLSIFGHLLSCYIGQKEREGRHACITGALVYLIETAADSDEHRPVSRFCAWNSYFAKRHDPEAKHNRYGHASALVKLANAYSGSGTKMQLTIGLIDEARRYITDDDPRSQRLLLPQILGIEIKIKSMLGRFEETVAKINEAIAFTSDALQKADGDYENSVFPTMLAQIYDQAGLFALKQGNSEEALKFAQQAIDLYDPSNPRVVHLLEDRLRYFISQRNAYEESNWSGVSEVQKAIRSAFAVLLAQGWLRAGRSQDFDRVILGAHAYQALSEYGQAKELLENALCNPNLTPHLLVLLHTAVADACVKMGDDDGFNDHISAAESSARQMLKDAGNCNAQKADVMQHLSYCANKRCEAAINLHEKSYFTQRAGARDSAAVIRWQEAANAAVLSAEECLGLYRQEFERAGADFDRLSVVSLPRLRELMMGLREIHVFTGNFEKLLETAQSFRGMFLLSRLNSFEDHASTLGLSHGWRRLRNIAGSLQVAFAQYMPVKGCVVSWFVGMDGQGIPPSWIHCADPRTRELTTMSTSQLRHVHLIPKFTFDSNNKQTKRAEASIHTSDGFEFQEEEGTNAEEGLVDVVNKNRFTKVIPKTGMPIELSEINLSQLYACYVQQMQAELPAPQNLVILIVEGETHRFPFAVLKDKKGAMFFEKYVIAHTPSAAVLETVSIDLAKLVAQRNINDISEDEVCIVGNPFALSHDDLSIALKEAENVARVWNTTPLTGKSATKKVVMERMLKAVIIHFALHSSAEKQDTFELLPGACYVAADNLQSEANADSVITGAEVERMDLSGCALVFLNSCNAGTGDTRSVEGLLGLVTAFISAGAKAVISCCEPVPDSEIVCEFAGSFHEIYRNKTKWDAPGALREAMLQMRRNDDYKDKLEHWGRYYCTCGVLPPDLRVPYSGDLPAADVSVPQPVPKVD